MSQEFRWGLWSLFSGSHRVLKCFNPLIYILLHVQRNWPWNSLVFGDLTVPHSTHAHTALDLIKWSEPILWQTIETIDHFHWNEMNYRGNGCHYRRLWRGCTKIRSVASRTFCCCCKQHKPSKRHTLLIRKLIFLLLKLVDKRGSAKVICRGCTRVSCRCIGVYS